MGDECSKRTGETDRRCGSAVVVAVVIDEEHDGPATRALVIGVSAYPYADGPEATESGRKSGIGHLSSASRSASEFAAWLMTEYRQPGKPLVSLRLLVSPIDGEVLHPRWPTPSRPTRHRSRQPPTR